MLSLLLQGVEFQKVRLQDNWSQVLSFCTYHGSSIHDVKAEILFFF